MSKTRHKSVIKTVDRSEFIFTKVCTKIEDKKFVDLVKKQIIGKEKWGKY
ncbi:hypothetical protein N3114_08765 [Aliarcobacter butzleri]|nr:hypothetical protein [Aliarcobacter butzleri]UXC28761.1 hypothetical protein N3114_08765 [Aliarcobacter butzleri]